MSIKQCQMSPMVDEADRAIRVLHITPHLGGGVGKAHAALAQIRAGTMDVRTRHDYALLELPRDIVYAEMIEQAGCRLHILPLPGQMAALVESADIVQIEWWNHPRLYHWLTSHPLPAMRLATWIHISGLAPPLVPCALLGLADHTFFTTATSFAAQNLGAELARRPQAVSVVNSGFGLNGIERRERPRDRALRFAYLGTIDFIKMHPSLFDFIDALEIDICLHIWGHYDAGGEVARVAAAMRHPERVRFEGYTSNPAEVLAACDVFLYLLVPGHYGTAENALIEAMSAGAVPIVWNNPSEVAIVEDGKTGFIVKSFGEFLKCIDGIATDPRCLDVLREKGRMAVEQRNSLRTSLDALERGYHRLMHEPKSQRDFRSTLGSHARAWFLSSLTDTFIEPVPESQLLSDRTSKGSLGHFRLCCPQDESLTMLDRQSIRVA